jgi:hypothetical protein
MEKRCFFHLAKAYASQHGSQQMAFFGSDLIFLGYWAVAFPCCASEQPRPYLATAAATVHHSYSQRQLRKSSIQSFTSTSVCQHLLNNQLLLCWACGGYKGFLRRPLQSRLLTFNYRIYKTLPRRMRRRRIGRLYTDDEKVALGNSITNASFEFRGVREPHYTLLKPNATSNKSQYFQISLAFGLFSKPPILIPWNNLNVILPQYSRTMNRHANKTCPSRFPRVVPFNTLDHRHDVQ